MTYQTSSIGIYPPPPWHLQGKAIQSVQPVDIDQVRPLVPPQLEIVPVFPGKTLAGLYISAYTVGSDLEYNELIVVNGVVRSGDRIGIWVSHIYVDNPHSVAGGREIWGLPKQIAEFDWVEGEHPRVSVLQEGQLLCRLSYRWQIPGLRQWLPAAGFSTRGSDLIWFEAEAKTYPHLLLGASVQIPFSSPFQHFHLDQPWLMFYGRQLDLTVKKPEVIGTCR